MDLTERLALIIDAHTDGAVSSVRKLSLEEKAAADRAELLSAKIADLNTRIAKSGGTATQQRQLRNLTSEYAGLTSTLGNVPKTASRVESALSKIGLGGIVPAGALGAASKVLPGLAAGAAAFGGFEFLKTGVDEYEALAGEIRDVQRASGAAAPDASRLVAITHALGLDSSVAALGLFRLGKNIDLQPQKLTAYGIAIARTSNGNTDLIGTLENVGTAYQKATDPARRAAIVYEAFGRAGQSMLPILAANRKQLQAIADEAARQGRIFNQDDLDKARDYQIATRELDTALQSLAITSARSLVPALTGVAEILTKVTDATNNHSTLGAILKAPFTVVAEPFKLLGHAFGVGGGHEGTSPAQAAQQLADQQQQAAQAALAQAAQGTLAGALDTLAGPANIRAAKKTLADAQNALTDARSARAKALRDLNSAQAGGPSSGAAQIEAANARVVAAEDALRTAQYLGGDRVSSARASLLSAQATLNRLRQSGATDTNRLADAEDRLRRANHNVAQAQSRVKDAQKARNDATGLNAAEVLKRVRGQADTQSGLAAANIKLATAGVSAEVIGGLDKLNQQIPGTLVKVAHTLNHGIVQQLNRQQGALDIAQQQFADAASAPDTFRRAGRRAGAAFNEGFGQALLGFTPFGPPGNRPSSDRVAPGGSALGLLAPPIQVHGDLVVKGHSARQVARQVARDSRLRSLSTALDYGPGGA